MNTPFDSRTCGAPLRLGLLILIAGLVTVPGSAKQTRPALPEGFISGVVESSQGPEAGVWVIAETEDLLTNFVKIVVTDDNGRFVLPELPEATYRVWVRGYGLVDSAPAEARVGTTELVLRASVAG